MYIYIYIYKQKENFNNQVPNEGILATTLHIKAHTHYYTFCQYHGKNSNIIRGIIIDDFDWHNLKT